MYQFHKRNYNRPQNIPDSRVFVNSVTGGSLQPSPVPQDETAALNGDQFDQVRSFHQNWNSIVEPIFIWWHNDIMLIPHLLEMNKTCICQFLWNSHHISTPLHSPTITTAPELVLEVNIFPQQSWQSQESKSPHSNLSSLKVPSDSESSRRPSNISVCTSDYSGRDFENALGGQIRELNLTGICQEASSPFFKDDEDDDHIAMVHRQIRELDLTWICHQATSPLPPRPPNLLHQEMNFSHD